jgi:V-type H+-transporting ATPase subunit H
MSKFFLEKSGLYSLNQILQRNTGELQVIYYMFLDLWILTFEKSGKSKFSDPKTLIIPSMIEAIKNVSREKVSRVAFKIFRNLSKWDDCVELMVDNNLLKVVDNELRKNFKDEVLRDNLEYLAEVLERNYRILSSYEKYNKEISTDKLSWGPCHSEKFWKENVKKFEGNDFGLIK